MEQTVRSRELGIALARTIAANGFRLTEIARRLGWSQTKISKMLSGHRGAHPEDVSSILALCGITGPKREELHHNLFTVTNSVEGAELEFA